METGQTPEVERTIMRLHYLQRAPLWLMISFGLVLLAVVLFVLLPAPPAGTTH